MSCAFGIIKREKLIEVINSFLDGDDDDDDDDDDDADDVDELE